MTTDPPPACVLVEQNSSATWFVRMENGTASGSGTNDCGLPGATLTTTTYGSNGPSVVLSAILYSVKTSPGVSFAVSCSPMATFTGTTGTNGLVEGEAEVSGGASVYPILLAAPNPQGRPDLGDGTNQEVYDAAMPTGYLAFPGGINVVGGTASMTQWLMRDPKDINGPHVGLVLDLPAESVAQDWNLYDQSILASVPASSILVKNGPYNGPNGSMADGFRYLGLPKSNSGLEPVMHFEVNFRHERKFLPKSLSERCF